MKKSIENMLTGITHINNVCQKYGGIKNVLDDTMIAQPALMYHICVFAINYENFLQKSTDEILNKDDFGLLTKMKNCAISDYEALDCDEVFKFAVERVPKIKENIDDFLNKSEKIC